MKNLAIGITIIAMFGAGIYLGVMKQQNDQRMLLKQDAVITVLPSPKALQDFNLKDHEGKKFNLTSLKDKWSLIFFGFTHCPDICPTTLATLNQLHGLLAIQPEPLRDTQFIFVSVDPGRDDIVKLKKYVTYFNREFTGVTGRKESIAALAKQLGAHFEILDKTGKKDYAVNHTAAIFITDKRARFYGLMSPPLDPAAMAARVKMIKQL